MRHSGEFAAALIASALLLASCSDPQAGPLPTPSPSVPTVSPTAPSATASLPLEFETAIRNYYVALNAAVRNPKEATDELARLIDPGCTCVQVVDLLREEARKGRYLDYQYSLRDLRIIDVHHSGGDATYTVVQSPGHERDADGKVINTFPGGTEKLSVHFSRTGSGWVLSRAAKVK